MTSPCGRLVVVVEHTSSTTGLRSTDSAFLLSLVTSDFVVTFASDFVVVVVSTFDFVTRGSGVRNVSVIAIGSILRPMLSRPLMSTVLSESTLIGPLFTVTVLLEDPPLPPPGMAPSDTNRVTQLSQEKTTVYISRRPERGTRLNARGDVTLSSRLECSHDRPSRAHQRRRRGRHGFRSVSHAQRGGVDACAASVRAGDRLRRAASDISRHASQFAYALRGRTRDRLANKRRCGRGPLHRRDRVAECDTRHILRRSRGRRQRRKTAAG